MNDIVLTSSQIDYLEDVVYLGLIPAGSVVGGGGGGGDPSDLYYSKIQLDAGQLDNRYYTETELNAGQLNNLYYTETEVNTWRNNVTSIEMGYLDGVTSDVQTQLTARAIIGATPADNNVCTWSSATTIKGEGNLTFDGTDLTIGAGDLKLLSNIDQTGTPAQLDINPYTKIRLGRSTNDAGFALDILKGDASATTNHSFVGVGNSYVCLDNGNFGIGVAVADTLLTVYQDVRNRIMLGSQGTGATFGTISQLGFNIKDTEGVLNNPQADRGGALIQSTASPTEALNSLLIANYDENLASKGYISIINSMVGINRTDPSYTHDVDGTGRFTGNLFLDAYIGTTNYVSETTGWRGTYAGAFDFRSIYTDELICKTFIADIDLALLSGTMVSKSITQVSRDFTVPATGNTGTLYVEAIPGFPTSQTFEDDDWIRLQVIDRSHGGLIWLKVYGQVDTFVDDGDGEQHYTFTTRYDGLSHGAIGETVYAGAGAQDLGQSGDGFIQSEAGSHSLNTPYIQTATWETNPYEGANITVRTRMGNLVGITNQTGFGFVTRKNNDNYVSQWWTSDSDWGIRGVVAGAEIFKLGDENVIAGFTIHATDGLYAGAAATRVQMKAGAGFWSGATAIGDAPFSVTNAGVLKAVSGTIGSWNIGTDAIYTGTKVTADDWSATGITLASNGAIHAPNFYVNTGGEIGLRQVESVLFKVNDSLGLKIAGAMLWENEKDADDGSIFINYNGFEQGSTRFRDVGIYDGKTNQMMDFDGSADLITIYTALTITDNTDITGTLDVEGEIRSTEVKEWSCAGVNFHARNPDVTDISYSATYGIVTASQDAVELVSSVSLPNGAIISSVEVFGNAAAAAGETWTLRRGSLATLLSTTLAEASINTEDTTITNATVDNDTYYYYLRTSSIDTDDAIYGARIKFVL